MPFPKDKHNGCWALLPGQKNGWTTIDGRTPSVSDSEQQSTYALGPFRHGTDSNTPMLLDATVASHKCQPLMKPCKPWLSLSWKWW